ncbi:uncharacterized protein LOC126971321 isoform X2 [Leptidea sinapis]|nr:uncharacterized protein LOC126971321 isoform X2 [Leptidea sinapis]
MVTSRSAEIIQRVLTYSQGKSFTNRSRSRRLRPPGRVSSRRCLTHKGKTHRRNSLGRRNIQTTPVVVDDIKCRSNSYGSRSDDVEVMYQYLKQRPPTEVRYLSSIRNAVCKNLLDLCESAEDRPCAKSRYERHRRICPQREGKETNKIGVQVKQKSCFCQTPSSCVCKKQLYSNQPLRFIKEPDNLKTDIEQWVGNMFLLNNFDDIKDQKDFMVDKLIDLMKQIHTEGMNYQQAKDEIDRELKRLEIWNIDENESFVDKLAECFLMKFVQLQLPDKLGNYTLKELLEKISFEGYIPNAEIKIKDLPGFSKLTDTETKLLAKTLIAALKEQDFTNDDKSHSKRLRQFDKTDKFPNDIQIVTDTLKEKEVFIPEISEHNLEQMRSEQNKMNKNRLNLLHEVENKEGIKFEEDFSKFQESQPDVSFVRRKVKNEPTDQEEKRRGNLVKIIDDINLKKEKYSPKIVSDSADMTTNETIKVTKNLQDKSYTEPKNRKQWHQDNFTKFLQNEIDGLIRSVDKDNFEESLALKLSEWLQDTLSKVNMTEFDTTNEANSSSNKTKNVGFNNKFAMRYRSRDSINTLYDDGNIDDTDPSKTQLTSDSPFDANKMSRSNILHKENENLRLSEIHVSTPLKEPLNTTHLTQFQSPIRKDRRDTNSSDVTDDQSVNENLMGSQKKLCIKDFLRTWLREMNLFNKDIEEQIVGILAKDIMDRQKYLEVSNTLPTSNEELEHLKYQIYKRLKSIISYENLPQVIQNTNDLFDHLKNNLHCSDIENTSFDLKEAANYINRPKKSTDNDIDAKENIEKSRNILSTPQKYFQNKIHRFHSQQPQDTANNSEKPVDHISQNLSNIKEILQKWFKELNILDNVIESNVVDLLAQDLVEKQNYFQLSNPRLSINDLSHKICKRLQNVVNEDDLSNAMQETTILYERLKKLLKKSSEPVNKTYESNNEKDMTNHPKDPNSNIIGKEIKYTSTPRNTLKNKFNQTLSLSSIHEEPHDASHYSKKPNENHVQKISHILNEWFGKLNMFGKVIQNKIVDLLTQDIIDRKNYLQAINTKLSNDMELEHLKYLIFKRLNNIANDVDLGRAMKYAAELFIPLKDVYKDNSEIEDQFSNLTFGLERQLKDTSKTFYNDRQYLKNDGELTASPWNSLKKQIVEMIRKEYFPGSVPNIDIVKEIDQFIENVVRKSLHRKSDLELRNEIKDLFNKCHLHFNDSDFLEEELIQLIKSVKEDISTNTQEELVSAMDEYKERIRDTITKTIPFLEGIDPSFEALKDKLADAFVSLHYIADKPEEKHEYRTKIRGEIGRFCDNFLKRFPALQSNLENINEDLYNALLEVSVPCNELLEHTLESFNSIQDIIREWINELPLNQSEQLLAKKSTGILELTNTLHKFKKKRDIPHSQNDESTINAIIDWLKKLPIGNSPPFNFHDEAEKLLNAIVGEKTEGNVQSIKSDKNTQYTPRIPPSTLSAKDKEHLQIVRERNSKSQAYKNEFNSTTKYPALTIDISVQTENEYFSTTYKRVSHAESKEENNAYLSPKVFIKEYQWNDKAQGHLSNLETQSKINLTDETPNQSRRRIIQSMPDNSAKPIRSNLKHHENENLPEMHHLPERYMDSELPNFDDYDTIHRIPQLTSRTLPYIIESRNYESNLVRLLPHPNDDERQSIPKHNYRGKSCQRRMHREFYGMDVPYLDHQEAQKSGRRPDLSSKGKNTDFDHRLHCNCSRHMMSKCRSPSHYRPQISKCLKYCDRVNAPYCPYPSPLYFHDGVS